MNEADALDILRQAFWTVVVASGPSIIVAMVVGIGIALLQALTQVQEATLTFIPKMAAIMMVLLVSAPLLGGTLFTFTEQLYRHIEDGF